jgi:hypothetical protein
MVQALVLSIAQEHISKAGKIGTKIEIKSEGEQKSTFIYSPIANDAKLNKIPGTYITVEKNDAGYYGISKVQEVSKIETEKTTDFEMKDPHGIFEEAKINENTKFDYAEKAFNKAFDIVKNKLDSAGLTGNTLEGSTFKGEDIRTMINTVFMQIMR